MPDFQTLEATYDILEEIGSGGGGTVYKAYHKRLQKYVVIKKTHEEVQGILDSRAEADILKNLRHSYLPQVLDFLELDGSIYTVMDYIPGESFQQLLKSGRTFTQKETVKWARQLTEAVAYLHGQNPPIIHGDIKPANIMLTPTGDICLIDFNISSVFGNNGAAAIGYSDGYSPIEQYPKKGKTSVPSHEKETERTAAFPRGESYEKTAAFLRGESYEKTAAFSRGESYEKTAAYSRGESYEKTAAFSRGESYEKTAAFSRGESKGKTAASSGEEPDEKMFAFLREESDEKTLAFLREESEEKVPVFYRENVVKETMAVSHESLEESPLPPSEPALQSDNVRIDERSDLYSLGATLYHLLTGTRPAKATERNCPIEEQNPSLSDGICYVVGKSMERDAKKRFTSAKAMLKALQQLDKLDKRYKRFLHKQEFIAILLMVMMTFSILSVYFGKEQILTEKKEQYSSYVEQMLHWIEEGNYDQMELIYEKAQELFPEELDSDYAKLLSLYNRDTYEEALAFMDTVIAERRVTEESFLIMADCYSIVGNCAFELENYEKAEYYFSKALSLSGQNGYFYRDEAIVLARLNRPEEAKDCLEQAIQNGLTQEELYQAQGEICYSLGEWEEAEKNFLNCVKVSEDDYIKMRAYVMGAKTYHAGGDIFSDGLEKEIALLEEAKRVLPQERNLMVYTALIQAYADYGDDTGDFSWYEKAIAMIEEEWELGRKNYNSANNLSLLYRKTGNLEQAKQVLIDMLELYGENYRTYKRLAFLETDIQGETENLERNYNNFAAYYQKAVALYEKEKQQNDSEMVYMDTIYQDLKEGRWFE